MYSQGSGPTQYAASDEKRRLSHAGQHTQAYGGDPIQGNLFLTGRSPLVREQTTKISSVWSTADMLTELGSDVIEASSAEEALGMVSEGLVPDLLVTDHLMPGLNGGELAFALKASQPDPQILIISGYAEAEGIDPGLPRLTKLFSNAELAASLSAFI